MMIDISQLDLSNFGGDESESLEQALSKNFKVYVNPDRRQIKLYGELTKEERIFLAQMKVRHRFSKDRYTAVFLENYEDYGVSLNGKGRTSLGDIFKNMITPEQSRMERLTEMLGRKH